MSLNTQHKFLDGKRDQSTFFVVTSFCMEKRVKPSLADAAVQSQCDIDIIIVKTLSRSLSYALNMKSKVNLSAYLISDTSGKVLCL